MEKELYDVIIIGLGPGGIKLGLELSQTKLNFLIIEKGMPSGKVNIAPRVDNYYSHPPISGPALAMQLFKQALDAKVPVLYDEVLSLTQVDNLFKVQLLQSELFAKRVVIASGTKEKKIGLAKEDKFLGHGLSYCALCDGHFYQDKDVVVIGGGNSAFKEAIHLSDIVHKLYLVHRRNEYRAEKYLVEELKSKNNVEFITPYIPLKLLGETEFQGVEIQNVNTKEIRTIVAEGIFPLVGQIPNTQFVNIPGLLDAYGNVITNHDDARTLVFGIYAIGDVTNYGLRQIYVAEEDALRAKKSLINDLKD